jgi:alpha-beta hydrolase superfamily lysophospholipase
VKSKQFQRPLARGGNAHVYQWLPDGEIRAVVQVVHGMAEHGGRYARLAQSLTGAGYAVFALDLPGHGRSVRSAAHLGHVADRDGWRISLDAINSVRQCIRNELHDPPIYMLGHSMGSYLLQQDIVEHGHSVVGAIFSATSGDLGPLRRIGLNLLRVEALWRGLRHRSALAERLSFTEFNRQFKPNRTAFDWLSRDEAEVDRYIDDKLCGFRCSNALWMDLLRAGGTLTDAQGLAQIPKQLPILLINGSRDAATRGEAGPSALERHYRSAQLEDVTLRLYADARHELFNETCRDEVTRDLLEWLNQRT